MTDDAGVGRPRPHSISIVIPVYRGETTLPALLAEIEPLTTEFETPSGHHAVVAEVLLVYDNGADNSPAVMRALAERYSFVRTVWLSRNFGQHPTTLAGMASSGGDWIATLDEDGQHDPQSLLAMLDVAMAEQADVVYAKPTNPPPHGAVRNLASRSAKRVLRLSTGGLNATDFQSYRLVLGELGRSVAAYAGPGVYLDVAMSWVARKVAICPMVFRAEGDRPSGYSFRSLLSHFWRMVLSSGTRALRLVSMLGVAFGIIGVVLAIYLLIAAVFFRVDLPQGWPSLMVAFLLCSGAILFALGVIAEYVGVAVSMAMGKPLYLIVSDPHDGPLGRIPAESEAGAAAAGEPVAQAAPADPAQGSPPADRHAEPRGAAVT